MAKTKRQRVDSNQKAEEVSGVIEASSGEIAVDVDVDKMELEDWERLDPRIDGILMNDVLDTLDRLVVGGVRGKGYSGLDLVRLQLAVGDALKQAMNPLISGKN